VTGFFAAGFFAGALAAGFLTTAFLAGAFAGFTPLAFAWAEIWAFLRAALFL
jgi:hypothetical protein